jgi:hypothetical protein
MNFLFWLLTLNKLDKIQRRTMTSAQRAEEEGEGEGFAIVIGAIGVFLLLAAFTSYPSLTRRFGWLWLWHIASASDRSWRSLCREGYSGCPAEPEGADGGVGGGPCAACAWAACAAP